jgi:hypothetical protein
VYRVIDPYEIFFLRSSQAFKRCERIQIRMTFEINDRFSRIMGGKWLGYLPETRA